MECTSYESFWPGAKPEAFTFAYGKNKDKNKRYVNSVLR